ncbi:MAG TPA: amidohydrolase family protein [Longimicrobium sp.]|uniref:amidohydrolase family protein n=1 Tax=Longimicrobium sp. TaxID=2029185 RepID=UPI002ED9D140
MMRSALCLAALLITGGGCGHVPAVPANAPRSGPAAYAVEFPVVDHHKHLPSPDAAEVYSAVISPHRAAVALPAELARLLREREERWNDEAALAELYTDSTVLFEFRAPDWVRGRSTTARRVKAQFTSAYGMTPVAYEADASGGFIAGYYTRGEGEDARRFGHFFLSLRRAADGGWRIAAENPMFPGPFRQESIMVEQLVAEMDAAGLRRAVVLSTAYWLASRYVDPPLPDEHARVRAENDWTARQVARFPDRLAGFCSVNPLRDYAVQELERCARELGLRGLKLHFQGGVDVLNAEHVRTLRGVFRAANALGIPIAVHVRGDLRTYGREHARAFLEQVLPAAPDVPVQIAHLWGGGAFSDAALEVYADAVAAGDPRTRNLYFDVSDIAHVAQGTDGWETTVRQMRTVAQRIRRIGVDRMLWGSDMSPPSMPARDAWIAFRTLVPLTEDEFSAIARNVAPYLR